MSSAEHHERCDGSGYPAGRCASGIALDSQLVVSSTLLTP